MKICMLINGEQTQARNGATFERCNPLDGNVATVHRCNALIDDAHGLLAAVFGRDIACALRVAARFQSGICHINGPPRTTSHRCHSAA